MDIDSRDRVFQLQAEICKTLADPKRLKIINELRQGELTVTDLSTRLGLSQSNTSQHISTLKRRGLLNARREGTSIYYSLSSDRIASACDLVHSFLMEQLKSGDALINSLSQK